MQCSAVSFATVCPDPANKDPIPTPWEKNPMSIDEPQYAPNTLFEQANILISGIGGIGVTCNYTYEIEGKVYHYSIWWRDGPTSKPKNSGWSRSPYGTGYFCKSNDYTKCVF